MANPALITKDRISEDLLAVLAANGADGQALREYLSADSNCDYKSQTLQSLDPGQDLRHRLEELLGITGGGAGVLPSAYRYRINERTEPSNSVEQNATYAFSAGGQLVHSLGLLNDPISLVNTVVTKARDYTVEFSGERGAHFYFNGPGTHFLFMNFFVRMRNTGYVIRVEGAQHTGTVEDFDAQTATWTDVGMTVDTRVLSVHDIGMISEHPANTSASYFLQAQGLVRVKDEDYGNYAAIRVVMERIGADGSDVAVPESITFLKGTASGMADTANYLDVITLSDAAEPVSPELPELPPPLLPEAGALGQATLTRTGSGDFLAGTPQTGLSVVVNGLTANTVYQLSGYATNTAGVTTVFHVKDQGRERQHLLVTTDGQGMLQTPLEMLVPVSQFQRLGNNGHLSIRESHQLKLLVSRGGVKQGYTTAVPVFIDAVSKVHAAVMTVPPPARALLYQIFEVEVTLTNFDPFGDYEFEPMMRLANRVPGADTWYALIAPIVMKNTKIKTGESGVGYVHKLRIPLELLPTGNLIPASGASVLFEMCIGVRNLVGTPTLHLSPLSTIEITNAG